MIIRRHILGVLHFLLGFQNKFSMVKLVVLTIVYYVFDEMPKRTKIYKNTKILTRSLKSSSSCPTPQNLAKFGKESETEEGKSWTWICLAVWFETVELPLIEAHHPQVTSGSDWYVKRVMIQVVVSRSQGEKVWEKLERVGEVGEDGVY